MGEVVERVGEEEVEGEERLEEVDFWGVDDERVVSRTDVVEEEEVELEAEVEVEVEVEDTAEGTLFTAMVVQESQKLRKRRGFLLKREEEKKKKKLSSNTKFWVGNFLTQNFVVFLKK